MVRGVGGWGSRICVPGGLAAPWAAWRASSLGSPRSACLAAGPRCQEQSGCGSVSMATRHLEPQAALPWRPAVGRRPSLAAPPGPAASKLGHKAEAWWEAVRRGRPIFLDPRTDLSFTSFANQGGGKQYGVLSSAHVQRSPPFLARKSGAGPGQGRRPSLAISDLSPVSERGSMTRPFGGALRHFQGSAILVQGIGANLVTYRTHPMSASIPASHR